MSTDPVIAQAAAAAATPADGPPAPVDVFKAYAEQKAQETAAADKARYEKMSPAERHIETIRKHPAFFDFNDPRRDELMRNYRIALENAATPEEQAAAADVTLNEAREFYDVPPPTLPSNIEYSEYEPWERDALVMFRQEGFDSKTARGLRDLGVKLALQVDGAPLADDVIDYELKKFTSLTSAQRTALKAYWRLIEGGGE